MPPPIVSHEPGDGVNNPALHKSLRLLAHPLSLASLIVLLVNDHLLRLLWPSWFTGKLGDLAWLFFAPLALAVALAIVLPVRLRHHTRLAAFLAFGLVGGIFILAKTVPTAHQTVVSVCERIFGFPCGLRRDPTDLLALVGLAGSAMLWTRAKATGASHRSATTAHRQAGWVALVMAALLTVANSPAPDPGIFCVAASDDAVYAFAAYAGFESTDGGFIWSGTSQQQFDCGNPWGVLEGSQMLESEDGRGFAYRYGPGLPIETSEDGGQTWQEGYNPAALSEAEQAMVQRRRGSNASIRATPLDGVIDRRTGNAVFAMGHSGVLVHSAQGEWQATAVNDYRAPGALSGSDIVELLLGEGLLALGTLLLAFVTLVTTVDRSRRAWLIFLLAVAWLVWSAIVFFLGPARLTGYGAAIGYLALLALAVLLAVALIAAIVRIVGGLREVAGRAGLVSVLAALLFLLPYGFWAINTLPSYPVAALFATALVIAAIAAGSRYVRAAVEPRPPPAIER
jgi:hypothetical protein